MKTTTEMEIKVSGGRILEAFVEPNGSCKLIVEAIDAPKKVTADEATEAKESVTSKAESQLEKEHDDDVFVLVEASQLSLDDEFMTHKPTTYKEEKLKDLLTEAIKKGLKDFYRPVLDPSFNEDGGICYIQGRKPAVNKSYNWWKETAIKFMPERCSRLGTKTEYVAFLGVLLKKLVKSGWSKAKAWDAVCNDSKELGHYDNSENATLDFTGSGEIVGYFDLANTYKKMSEDIDTGCFWLVGGYYYDDSRLAPLAALYHYVNHPNYEYFKDVTVGWLVLER